MGDRKKRKAREAETHEEKRPTGSRNGAWLRVRSAPIPRTTIVSGEAVPVKTALRRKRRGLDRDCLPAKTNTILGRGNGSSLELGDHNQIRARSGPLVGSEISGRSQQFFTFSLTANGLLIEARRLSLIGT